MGNEDGGGRTKRFAAYLAELASVLGDARRSAAMISYCTGLLLPSERKSVEPMAALTAPTRTAAQHQSLLHFVGQGEWSDDTVMERIRAYTIARIERHGALPVLPVRIPAIALLAMAPDARLIEPKTPRASWRSSGR